MTSREVQRLSGSFPPAPAKISPSLLAAPAKVSTAHLHRKNFRPPAPAECWPGHPHPLTIPNDQPQYMEFHTVAYHIQKCIKIFFTIMHKIFKKRTTWHWWQYGRCTVQTRLITEAAWKDKIDFLSPALNWVRRYRRSYTADWFHLWFLNLDNYCLHWVGVLTEVITFHFFLRCWCSKDTFSVNEFRWRLK